VIGHLLSHAPEGAQPHFYRTAAGAELDLVIETGGRLEVFEAKFGLSPTLSKGYHHALADLGVSRGRIVYSGTESYVLAPDAEVSTLTEAKPSPV